MSNGTPSPDLVANSIADRGLGVEQDKSKALEWLRKAASLDCVPALEELASCLETGSLGVKDEEESSQWRSRLASLGA